MRYVFSVCGLTVNDSNLWLIVRSIFAGNIKIELHYNNDWINFVFLIKEKIRLFMNIVNPVWLQRGARNLKTRSFLIMYSRSIIAGYQRFYRCHDPRKPGNLEITASEWLEKIFVRVASSVRIVFAESSSGLWHRNRYSLVDKELKPNSHNFSPNPFMW